MNMVNQALPVILCQVNLQYPESRPAARLIVFGWELGLSIAYRRPWSVYVFLSDCRASRRLTKTCRSSDGDSPTSPNQQLSMLNVQC